MQSESHPLKRNGWNLRLPVQVSRTRWWIPPGSVCKYNRCYVINNFSPLVSPVSCNAFHVFCPRAYSRSALGDASILWPLWLCLSFLRESGSHIIRDDTDCHSRSTPTFFPDITSKQARHFCDKPDLEPEKSSSDWRKPTNSICFPFCLHLENIYNYRMRFPVFR